MKYEDLTGRRFGRLVVVSREMRTRPSGVRLGGWICRCDCGTEKWVSAGNLTGGGTNSCGCLSREVHKKHGLSKDPLHKTWCSVRLRITKESSKDYPNYGGRGLVMEPEWVEDFALFRSWILANIGPKPSRNHTLDRIENHLGYLKGNLRWATQVVQQNNRRSNRRITRDGETLTLKQWCIRLGLNYGAVKMRVNAMAWPIEVALTVPTDGTRVKKLRNHTQESSHATA